MLTMLGEVGSNEEKMTRIEGIAPGIVPLMELPHSFLNTPIVFELKDVDVLSGEYLKVAPSPVAVMLGYHPSSG